MHYPYNSAAEASHAGQMSSAPGYDMNGYVYQPASRVNSLTTAGEEYPFSSYPATAPLAEESTASPTMYTFAGNMNGHSTYMNPANRLPPPNPAYSPYPPAMSVLGQSHHSPALAQAGIPQRQHGYGSGRSSEDAYDRTPQIPPIAMSHHRYPLADPAAEHNRTPRTQPPQLNSTPAQPNDYPINTPQSSSGEEMQAGDFEAAIPEEKKNGVITPCDTFQLDDKCSDAEVFVYEAHRRHSNHRGKGMWETICQEFHREFKVEKPISVAALQMKLTRTIREHGLWPHKVFSAVIKIYLEEERLKYNRYAALVKEALGPESCNIKAGDVEAILNRAGIEDSITDIISNSRESAKQRRDYQQARNFAGLPKAKSRKKSSRRSRTASWDTGFTASPITGQQQFPLPDPGQPTPAGAYNFSYQTMAAVPTPVFTEEQQNALMRHLDRRYGQIDCDGAGGSNYSNSPGDHTMSGSSDTGAYERSQPSPSFNYSAPRSRSQYN